MKSSVICLIVLLGAGSLDAQTVLSRRVYAEHGRTWRQLWIAKSGSTEFRQLTNSARDHVEPLCSRDGQLIYFVSDRDGIRSLNAYAGANDRQLWVFDRRTGEERQVWQTADDDELHLAGITIDGSVLIRVGTELHSLSRPAWKIDNVDGASNSVAVSPDGRTLAIVIGESLDKEGQSLDASLFLVDVASRQSRIEVGKYQDPTWSPNGKQIAAIGDDGLSVIEVATQKQVALVGWPKQDRPPEDLIWSPDGKYVMAGLYGEDAGSGDPQRDYFLLDMGAQTWTPTLTANQVLWLQGGSTLLYRRPVDTTPLKPGSKHEVWTTQLASFDLAAHQGTPLTTGLVLNDYLSPCSN
jgi:dipeptidyl aminopeptidase/acylaminoacyl peptidase